MKLQEGIPMLHLDCTTLIILAKDWSNLRSDRLDPSNVDSIMASASGLLVSSRDTRHKRDLRAL